MNPTYCKFCKMKIAFLKTDGDKIIPVDWDSLLPSLQSKILEGANVKFEKSVGMISHFSTCPGASMFRKKKR